MNYTQFKKIQSDRINNFDGIMFAFSNKQLEEGLEKLNVTTKDIVSIGMGGYVIRERIAEFTSLRQQNEDDLKALVADPKRLTEALRYELSNHEYCYTYDATDALECFNLTYDTVDAEVLREAIAGCNTGAY